MRISARGQVTIPIALRERAGLTPDTEIECEFVDGAIRIVAAGNKGSTDRGSRLVAHLRGRGDVTLSTDAIMALTRGD